MRPFSAAALLDVWERGQALPPARQALLLMAAASPDEDPGARDRLPVGRRDAELMTLRSYTFGDRLDGVVPCPACREVLELDTPLDALRADAPDDVPEVMVVERGDYTVRFRLPTAGDLAAAVGDRAAGPGELLARCVVEAEDAGKPVPPHALPDQVVAAVARGMEEADPQADVRLHLTCPACEHHWETRFDIVSYFWTEIEAWARRTLRDVHALACAYGWTEADILSLSAWRRRGYLSLIHR